MNASQSLVVSMISLTDSLVWETCPPRLVSFYPVVFHLHVASMALKSKCVSNKVDLINCGMKQH